jgi:hypothetical protein
MPPEYEDVEAQRTVLAEGKDLGRRAADERLAVAHELNRRRNQPGWVTSERQGLVSVRHIALRPLAAQELFSLVALKSTIVSGKLLEATTSTTATCSTSTARAIAAG